MGHYGYISKKARVHHTAIIEGDVWIDEDVEIGPYCVIGTRGEYNNDKPRNGKVIIRKGAVIRELTTIQVSVDGNPTEIGEDCYIMNKCHIAHDVKVGRGSVISTGTIIGGWCNIGERVNIGLGTVIHQRKDIGRGAMIGMNSTITKDIPPYLTVSGSPARIMGLNKIGLHRMGEDARIVDDLDYHFFFCLKAKQGKEGNKLMEDIYQFYHDYPKALDKLRGE
jgi:UDP-N-acetylglucosamine acyltransferase